MRPEPTPTNVRHLLTRAAWIGTAADVEAGTSRTIADTVSTLLDTPPASPPPEPRHDPSDEAEILYPAEALAHWFFELAVTSTTPAVERLTWFWTGHFANQVDKIEFPSALYRQFVLLRDLGLGNFEDLIRAITNDAAMNLFLDLHANTKDQINENYGRELLELFTMGRDNGYTQADVIEVSRALTGIGLTYPEIDDDEEEYPTGTQFNRRDHDTGTKAILGERGDFGVDETMAIIAARPETHGFLATRLWHRYAGTPIPADVRDELASVYGRELSIRELLRAMLTHPAFYADEVRGGLVAAPVESLVRAYRGLELQLTPIEIVDAEEYEVDECVWMAYSMGQIPGHPPNVGGWPHNEAWLDGSHSSGRVLGARLLVERLAEADSAPARRIHDAAGAAELADALAAGFGVAAWTPQTRTAIDAAARIDEPYERLDAAVTAAFTSPEVIMS